jgi:hypothetical protein
MDPVYDGNAAGGMYKGQKILPNSPHIVGPKGEAEDSSRVRADGTPALDMSDFGMPYAIDE